MAKNIGLSRRLFLQGFAGLGVLLPALELTHGRLWSRASAATNSARRFIVFFEHGGTIASWDNDGNFNGSKDGANVVDGWTPKSASGAPLVLGDIHQKLVGYEDYMLVLGGVDNLANKIQGPYNGDHGWANNTVLTNAKAQGDASAANFAAFGPSIDAVIAGRMAKTNPVPFPSINLAVPAHNYGTPFWQAANQPIDGEEDPSAAFAKLFAGVTGGTPDPAIVRARALKKSVLDGTSAGLALYKNKVSARDRVAIDAHLTLIRGIEQQLDRISTAVCTKPTITGPFHDANNADILQAIGPAQADILVAAIACGLTNVATLNVGDFYNKWMNPPYPAAYDIGHSLDHSANDVGPGGPDTAGFNNWYSTILSNRQWRADLVRRILEGLKNTPEGGTTMLDNSLLLWTSEFSYGGMHSVANLPIVLAGKAGGQLKTNRYLNLAGKDPTYKLYQTSATLGNLYTSILNLCGYPDTMFGETWSDYKEFNYGNPFVSVKSVTGPLPGLV